MPFKFVRVWVGKRGKSTRRRKTVKKRSYLPSGFTRMGRNPFSGYRGYSR